MPTNFFYMLSRFWLAEPRSKSMRTIGFLTLAGLTYIAGMICLLTLRSKVRMGDLDLKGYENYNDYI
jgi:hypothetical protein